MAGDLSVVVDGVELNDPNARHGYFEVDDISSGWWSSPAKKSKDQARPNSDGDFEGVDNYEARYFEIAGAFVAKSDPDRWLGANQLSALLARGSAQISIRADGQVQWATVKRTDQQEANWTAPRLLEFVLSFKASDPRKYGQRQVFEATTSQGAAVFHRGTYPAIPRAVVSGSMPDGYTVLLGGSTVVVSEPLVSGKEHVLDYGTGRLYVDGVLKAGGLSTAGFSTVAPGQRDSLALTPGTSGSGQVELTVWDTYI